jgi:hypothetical protein
MKTRPGFVSNSSSSSFVLLKSDMTELQILQMKEWITEYHNKNYDEGYPIEGKKCFYGEVSNHSMMYEFLEGIDVNLNDLEWSS